jgi:hypothetical protein
MIETCRWAVEAVRKEGNPFWVALLNRAERDGKIVYMDEKPCKQTA